MKPLIHLYTYEEKDNKGKEGSPSLLLKKFRIFVALLRFFLFLLLGVHLTAKADGEQFM
jgi:hypothetical protein